MFKSLAAMVLTSFLFAASSASAVTITVNGELWNITNVRTSYANDSALLESQIWWNDRPLGRDFAEAYITQVPDGTPSVRFIRDAGTTFVSTWIANPRFRDSAGTSGVDRLDITRLYAVGEFVGLATIPLPASLPLLLAGLGALGYAGARRRKTV